MTAKSTIQARAARASVAGFASIAANIAFQIISVPVILTYWGAERYGAWLAVMAGFMMARAVDGGYTGYVGNQINVLYHSDREELKRTLGSSLAICIGLGALQLSLCIGIVAMGLAPALLGVTAGLEKASEVSIALVVLIFTWMLAGSYPSIIHRLMIPAGMLVNSTWLALGYQTAQFAIIMGAAVAGATLLQAAVMYAAVQAAVYLASAEYVRRKLPTFYPWWRGGSIAIGLRDLFRSAALTANTGAQQASVSGTILIISSLLGAMVVPAFTTVRTFANLWISLGGVLASALSPEVVRYYATSRHEKLALAFRVSTLFGGLAVNLSLLAIVPIAENIYATWTKGAISFDQNLFLYLVASVSVANAALAYSMFLTAINSLNAQLLITLVRSCVALGVAVMSIATMGLTGVGLGILLGEGVAYVMAAFVFAPYVLGTRGANLSRFDQAEGCLMSLPVVAVSLIGVIFGKLPLWLIFGAFFSVSYIGWRMWSRLPLDARNRVKGLFRGERSAL